MPGQPKIRLLTLLEHNDVFPAFLSKIVNASMAGNRHRRPCCSSRPRAIRVWFRPTNDNDRQLSSLQILAGMIGSPLRLCLLDRRGVVPPHDYDAAATGRLQLGELGWSLYGSPEARLSREIKRPVLAQKPIRPWNRFADEACG